LLKKLGKDGSANLRRRRRQERRRPGAGREEHYRLGSITIDVPTRSVRRGAEPVVLRPKEFDLLVALRLCASGWKPTPRIRGSF
jgi:DNA-binding response OmpR family regulator